MHRDHAPRAARLPALQRSDRGPNWRKTDRSIFDWDRYERAMRQASERSALSERSGLEGGALWG
jgi:hypothetical protein